jgi:phage head maturation protease
MRADDGGMFKRNAHVHIRSAEDGATGLTRLNILASTDDAVDMGGWREVLSHAEGAIEYGAASALLVNHNPNLIAGALREFKISGKAMEVCADLDESARMDSQMPVVRAVEIGALRGASVGYSYDRKDCTFDEGTRTVKVSRWRLLELSLTPTPADAAAGIRSIPFDFANPTATEPHKERTMSEPIAPAAPTAPAASPETITNAVLAEQRQVAELARSLKLDASQYVGKTLAIAKDEMLAEIGKRASAHVEPQHAISITIEDADKQADAIAKAYEARVYGKSADNGNPYAGMSLRRMAARFARKNGIRTEDWSERDEAHFALGELSQVRGMRDAPASVITSSFPNFVFLNSIAKIVAKGFEQAPKGLTGQSGATIYDTQMVPDFKTYTVGGLGVGNLVETAENTAFPELAKTEGAYSSVAKMWGGTISLSLQALISDDTAQFDRALRQAGPIAQKTIERRLVQKFLRGIATTDASTWTNNTTSGCTPVWTTSDTLAASRANIGKGAAALANKVGLDGTPTANMPRFVFAGPTSGNYLAGLLSVAPGQTVQNAVLGQYELVVSPWLEASAITGNSTTSYYLIADPMLATGLILSKINGYETIQVQEFDAGATGARKWKMWMPFEADMFWAANSAGTSTIFAAQQCTT